MGLSLPLISKWHWLQKPKFQCLHLLIGVSPPLGVSSFWSASDTDFNNLSWVSPPFDQGVSTFGCLCLLIRVSPPLGVSAFWSGCFCHLISKWHWLQKPKSKLWQGIVSALISKWHWLQKPKFGCLHLFIRVFLPFDQGVSAFWSASDTDFKNLSLGVSTFWSECLHLSVSLPLISKWHWLQKPKFKLFGWGVVSTFWSASDTNFKNLSLGVSAFLSGCLCLLIRVSLPFDQGVSAFWSASDTDFKNLSLGVSTFWSECLHLWVSLPLISKWHWLQKPKFQCLHLLIGVSPPLGVSSFWSASDTDFNNLSWVSPPFDQGVSTFGCLCLLIRVSPPLGVSAFWSGCFCHLISKWHWLQKPKSKLWQGIVSALISKWHWLQKPKFGCLHLFIRVFLPFDQGVSAFWSASDTDFKNLSLGVSTFWSECLHLSVSLPLISKWHWLQKPKFKLFGWGVVSTFWSASDTNFKNLSLGVSTFSSGCFCLLIRVSLPFDQQVTLTSKT